MSEGRYPKAGDAVVFVDEHGVAHDALLTVVWGAEQQFPNPTVNLVYVSKNDAKRDPYGQQLERNSSVVHRSRQYTNGMFWRFADEV